MLGDRLNALQMAACNKAADSIDSVAFIDSYVAQILDPELRQALKLEVSTGENGVLCTFKLETWLIQIVGAIPGTYVIRCFEMSVENIDPLSGQRRQEFSTNLLRSSDVQNHILLLLRDLTRKNTLATQINKILS